MATDREFAEYAVEQLNGAGAVRSRKMFGEYMIYVNDKPMLLVCDNTVFVRKHECLGDLMKDADTGIPYKGAREHYVVDIDDAALCRKLVGLVEPLIEVPKPKKKA